MRRWGSCRYRPLNWIIVGLVEMGGRCQMLSSLTFATSTRSNLHTVKLQSYPLVPGWYSHSKHAAAATPVTLRTAGEKIFPENSPNSRAVASDRRRGRVQGGNDIFLKPPSLP